MVAVSELVNPTLSYQMQHYSTCVIWKNRKMLCRFSSVRIQQTQPPPACTVLSSLRDYHVLLLSVLYVLLNVKSLPSQYWPTYRRRRYISRPCHLLRILMSMADEWNIKMEKCWNDSDRGSPKYSEKMPVKLLSKIRVIIRHLCDINPWLHSLAVVMERQQYAKRLIGTVTKFHPLYRWYYYSHNNHREKSSVAMTSNTTYRTLNPLNCCNIQGPFIQDNCTSAINDRHMERRV